LRGKPEEGAHLMMALQTTEDLLLLRETSDLECKKAAGVDGAGEIPKDFWKTYSVMANTDGGTVLLGFRKSWDSFFCMGLRRSTR